MNRLALLLLAACGGSAKGSFQLTVTDGGAPIAARVLLFREGAPLHLGAIDLYNQRQGSGACAWAPGVIGTWDGIVLGKGTGAIPIGGGSCAVPAGHYKAWAWRGIEYDRWEGEVEVAQDHAITIPLTRAWTPKGLAADLHVHAHGSNDSTMPDDQRISAQAAAGIRVSALSNHNQIGDASAAIHALGLERVIASLPSDEVTAESMHAGIYPAVSAPPAAKVIDADPKTLLAMLRALPDHPVIQINHPRFRYQSLFDTTHWDGVSWPPPFPTDFDAIEVTSGYDANNTQGDRRLDETLRDFYTLYAHGMHVAAVGGSDTHDFNWVLDGTARTYVMIDHYEQQAFVDAIRACHTEATTGPYLDVSIAPAKGERGVGPGDTVIPKDHHVWFEITVAQASFVKATRLKITTGTEEQTLAVPAGTHHFEGDLTVPEGATFIGVSVEGDEPLPLELTGTYQKDKWGKAGITPFAAISPVLVR